MHNDPEDIYLYGFYIILSFFFYFHFQYFYDAPDMYQYMTIAIKYLEGNFSEAVNSYWGPLLSWLLVPVLILEPDPFFALKFLQIGIGFLTLLISFRYIRSSWISLRVTAKLILIPLILYYALLTPSPDLLFLCLLLLLVLFLSKERPDPFKTGITGALLFFAKGIGFFLVPMIMLAALLLKTRGKGDFYQTGYRFLYSFLIFLLCSSCWIFCLSVKEGKITLGSAGKYNFNLIGTGKNLQTGWAHPIDNNLFEPFSANATSAWEEPDRIPLQSWNVLESGENFLYYLSVLTRNIKSIFYFSFGRHAGSVVLLCLLALLLSRQRMVLQEKHRLVLLSAGCITGIYALILVTPRYIWLNIFVSLFLFVLLVEKIRERSKAIAVCLMAVMVFAVLGDLLLHLARYDAVKVRNSYQAAVQTSPAGPFAGIRDPAKESYSLGCLISLYSGKPFYGTVSPDTFRKNNLEVFREKGIKEVFARDSLSTALLRSPLYRIKPGLVFFSIPESASR